MSHDAHIALMIALYLTFMLGVWIFIQYKGKPKKLSDLRSVSTERLAAELLERYRRHNERSGVRQH